MKKVQFTLDEELIEAVDQISRQLGTTRTDFVRQACMTPWNAIVWRYWRKSIVAATSGTR